MFMVAARRSDSANDRFGRFAESELYQQSAKAMYTGPRNEKEARRSA
jgi:hypothetical protein